MASRVRVWTSIAVLCGSAGVAGAQPAGSPIMLWWEPSGSGCPSGDAVMAEVERLLGGKPNATMGRRMIAHARVAQQEDGTWKLTLHTRISGELGTGERVLEARSCEGLARAAALIVALGFDPMAVAAQAELAALGASPPPPIDDVRDRSLAPLGRAVDAQGPRVVPEGPPPAPPLPRPAPPAQRPLPARADSPSALHVGVGFGAGGDVGTFSTPAYAFRGWGRLRYERLQLAATAAYLPSHRTQLPELPTVGGMFTVIAGDLSTCYALLARPRSASSTPGSLELAPCGGVEIGRIRAEGYGVAAPGEGAALWLAPHAGGAVTIALTERLDLRAEVGVAIPVARHEFILERVGVIEVPGAVAGRLGAGVEVYF